ncbi:MAG TPA: hypothetical protein V6C91_05455 [Coleofasciculaceae cyanobacterium]
MTGFYSTHQRSLVTAHWSPIVGHWSLVTGCRNHRKPDRVKKRKI